MDQCNPAETTFQVLEADERFKKLQRSLKLALLKNLHNKNVDNKLGETWSNISSINGDTSTTSYLNPTMSRASSIKSEILTSSNNLKNIVLKKKHHNTNNQKIMATSSVKQYNVEQDKLDQFVMPPPIGSKVYRTDGNKQGRIHMLSNGKQAVSTERDGSAQFSLPNTFPAKSTSTCISSNINVNKDHPQSYAASKISANNTQKVNRVFSRWKVLLNNQCELIIKGTLECGTIAHSKPIVRRYTATCIESKFGHKYLLQGNIVDGTNALPDYVREKFYNGFPDDWENVYQIWQTYINQGCPLTFRWPTPITDSDDDLKSEMTDLTYTRMNNVRANFKTTYRSAEHVQSEYLNNNSPNKKEKYNCSANNSRSYKKNASFAKSFIPDSENDTTLIAQTRNVNLTYDEDNEQNSRSNVNTELNSSRKTNKLKDYIQEDKLNIIINNLVDKNCSQMYIDKIVEMFDCLNYVTSYRPPSACNYDLTDLESQDTFKSESIPIQQIIMRDNNPVNNIENGPTELKSNAHSTDLGYESIKNDFITTHQSNPVSIEPKRNDHKDSDKLESEIYAGVPKVSIEQVLRHRERSYKRPARRKIIPQQYAMDPQRSARGVGSEPVQTTISITNAKETSPSESYTRTRDEATNTGGHHEAIVHQRPHETFSINQEIPRNNVDTHEGNKSAMRVQNQQFDAFDASNLNAFMKEQKVSRGIAKFPQRQTHSQVVSDVDCTIDSDIDMITMDTNMQKSSVSTMPHIYLDEDIVISNESNSNFPEKSHVPRELGREFIRQPESEIAMKRSKPIITSSIPVNLNLKMYNTNLKPAQSHESDAIVKEDKQCANNRLTEEVRTKEPILSTNSAIITNDSHSKTTADNKSKAHPNKKNSKMNPATKRSNSGKLKSHPKVLIAWMPKVVHYAKSNYKLGLIFQGKLLNDAGHVASRNFTTDIILKRLSETLIETVNHEFYELRGHLNDSKHNISKKLVIQCRNGCPADIKQFCLTWETLQNDNLHDASMDLLETPISSRGRKIVPPLCFWEGERISLKDDNPVYNLGSSQESSLASLRENSNEALNIKKTRQQKVDSKSSSKMQNMEKQKLFKLDENSDTNRKQTPKVKTASTAKKKATINGKRQIAKRFVLSSTDSEEEEEVSPRKRLRNAQPKIDAEEESLENRLRRQTFFLRSKSSYKNN